MPNPKPIIEPRPSFQNPIPQVPPQIKQNINEAKKPIYSSRYDQFAGKSFEEIEKEETGNSQQSVRIENKFSAPLSNNDPKIKGNIVDLKN